MKREILIAMMVLACTAVFAAGFNMSIGLSQSLATSAVTGSFSFGSVEIEGSLGLPTITPSKVNDLIKHPVATGAVMATLCSDTLGPAVLSLKAGVESEFAMTFTGNKMGVGSFGAAFGCEASFGHWSVGLRSVVAASDVLGLLKKNAKRGFYVISGTRQDLEYNLLSTVAYNTGNLKIYGKYAL